MDFYSIKERNVKNGVVEVYPDFKVSRTKDIMIRGKSFYAIWDESAGLWSTDEYDVQRLVDADVLRHKVELETKTGGVVVAKLLGDFSSNMWQEFQAYAKNLADASYPLDETITFSNTPVKKTDYISRRLSYPLERGSINAYEEIISTLYCPEERAKIEWAIGAIISGDAKNIQKFLVFYGPGGTGKSTVLNIIQKMFHGYYTSFEAKALTSNNNAFATEAFKSNPLIAIQHDGDLSKIEDNTKLNSIVSHEEMQMNEKYKPSYMARINAFLLLGTNNAVKITDGKSGIIRRLIDVKPTGDLIAPERYRILYSQVDFELSAIANHCLDTYRSMGKDYYSSYRPTDMMMKTDLFFNFISESYDIFKEQDGVTLHQGYEMYKHFCETSGLEFKMAKFKFREELKNYFGEFHDRIMIDGERVRSWYAGFDLGRFITQDRHEDDPVASLTMELTESIIDSVYSDRPAQYANDNGTPGKFWDDSIRNMTDPKDGVRKDMVPPPNLIVSTVLSDLDTTKIHYLKLPDNHIVVDFDLTGDDGEKSAEKNIQEASKWPATYSEFSKSGGGVHLHYIYDGDVSELSRIHSDGIEIKVFTGNSSLRRRLSHCNNTPIKTINSGLPLREKKVISTETLKSEKSLRDLLIRNLNKEIHASTKPSIDFIEKILSDAHKSGMAYDVSDMMPRLMLFANQSSNQALHCLRVVQGLKYKSEKTAEELGESGDDVSPVPDTFSSQDNRLVFFDTEVFPNLFLINWKFEGDTEMVRMINPKPHEVEALFKLNLAGFNCRKYDNHIMYAASMGYTNHELYLLSKKIIGNVPGALFGEAYNISYVDIFDYSSEKMSLKKWQFRVGLPHHELGLDWDEPVPEELWPKVSQYCDSDVITTEAVHNECKQDFMARLVLADLSGLPVNATTNRHTTRIVFGTERKPQSEFIYTDLSKTFPGYKFEFGKSSYKGEDPGEGGYVYAEPGMYKNVALLDIASMHPNSIRAMNTFGGFTKGFTDLVDVRVAIKHKNYDLARSMLGGKLAPYLKNPDDAIKLSTALKLAINSVYGLTSAKFDNEFRDIRNVDNIVAKRGALFMIDLKALIQSRGFTVVHIKTDSVKIADATPEIIAEVTEFGKRYGYDFEHEATYEKLILINKSTYACLKKKGEGKTSEWEATGTQFIHPYVFKKLFSHQPVEFQDLRETKSVTTALYLDFNVEKDISMALEEYTPHFVGKVGQFTPILPGRGGATLTRFKDGAYHAAAGSSGYLWMESHMVETLNKQDDIDFGYFNKLVDDSITNIKKFGDSEEFLS